MKRYKWVLFTFLIIVITTSTSYGRVYLDVFGKSYKKITIAIPPFKGETSDVMKTDMNQLLMKDLDLSGFFLVAPQSLMDDELTSEGMEKHEINFGNWRSIGIELLCKTRYQQKDGDIIIEAYIHDTLDGSLMLAKRYRSKVNDWRKIVHRLADDILLVITGEKGINSARVVFASGSRNRKDIYMADIDGSDIRRMTNFRSISLSPSVSPDGKYLAYTSYKEGRPNLYIVNLENNREVFVDRGEGMKLGTNWTGKSTLTYSHASGRYSTIYALDAENKSKKVIIRSEGIYATPSFSSDGTKMAFVSDMYGSPQVFIRDLSTGEAKRLTYSGTYNTSPNFSPKGDLIAFVSRFEGSFEICVMNADGSNQRVLTSGGINDSPQFSPCGRYIIYSSNRGGKTQINIMLFNGENKRTLRFSDGDDTQPKFVP